MFPALSLCLPRSARHETVIPFRLAFLAYCAILVNANLRDVHITSVEKPNTVSLSLERDADTRFRLIPSAKVISHNLSETEIFIQWLPRDQASVDRIALLVSNSNPRPNIRFVGPNCSDDRPCFDAQYVDDASFFAKPGYAFIQTPLSNTTNVLLYRQGGAERPLAGKLVISPRRIKNNVPFICGGKNGEMCSNRGNCTLERRGCVCNQGRSGRFCEDPVYPFRGCPKLKSHRGRPLQLDTTLEPNTWYFYRFVPSCQAEPGGARDFTLQFDKRKKVYVVIKSSVLDEACSSYVDTRRLSPSLLDHEKCGEDPSKPGKIMKIQDGDGFRNSIFGFYSPHRTKVRMIMEACANPRCASDNRAFHGLHFLILPICLCILCVAAAIVCVLLYVDRRHGLVTGPDKLSESELGLMCPAYTLETLDDPEHAEHKTCSICISEFQVGDALRRLKCDHRFHSACIDPWLTLSNASCPTCREEARIPELSERRIQRAIVKHVLAPMLRLPLRARRRRMSSAIPALWRSSVERSSSNDGSSSEGRGIPYCADEARASYTENARPTPPNEPTPRQSREIVLNNIIEQAPSAEPSTWESEDVILPNYSSPARRNDESEVELGMPSYSPPTPPPEPTAEEMAEEDAANAGTFPDRIRGAIFEKSPPSQTMDGRNESVISSSSSVDTSSLAERGISSCSFYTEPLNYDMAELHTRGVLPHVRENLRAPANEPTVPEPTGKARERRDSDE